MKDEINNNKNQEDISENITKKYITVKRNKSKNKKMPLFSENDKENINNNIYISNNNNKKINNNITRKKRKSFTNSFIPFNKTMKNNNTNTFNKKYAISICPSKFNYLKEPRTNDSKTNKEKEKGKEKGRYTINSYLNKKNNNRPKIVHNFSNNNLKNKKNIKIKSNKISNTFTMDELYKFNHKTINNNKYGINKDTIFVHKIDDTNTYNTISANLNKDYYNNKQYHYNKNENNRKKIIDKNNNTKADTIESYNTLIIKRSNSALLTFGNINDDDSLSEFFSKENKFDKNYLLILKQENESLKYELMKTKEKVDILGNKIENLISEKNANNNTCLKQMSYIHNYAENYQKIKININIKEKNNMNGKNNISLKPFKSQKNFKYINNKTRRTRTRTINSNKTRIISRDFSEVFMKRKNK